jgi:hypothetical protein
MPWLSFSSHTGRLGVALCLPPANDRRRAWCTRGGPKLNDSVKGRPCRSENNSVGAEECDNFPNGPITGMPVGFHLVASSS